MELDHLFEVILMDRALAESVVRAGEFDEGGIDTTAYACERGRLPGSDECGAILGIGDVRNLRDPEIVGCRTNPGFGQAGEQGATRCVRAANPEQMPVKKGPFVRRQREVEWLTANLECIRHPRKRDERRCRIFVQYTPIIVGEAQFEPRTSLGEAAQGLGPARQGAVRLLSENSPGSKSAPVRHGWWLGRLAGPYTPADDSIGVWAGFQLPCERGFGGRKPPGGVGGGVCCDFLHQPGYEEDVSQSCMKDGGAGKETVREALVEGEKSDLVPYALFVRGKSLLGAGNGFARKQDPANHDREVFTSVEAVL